MHKIHLFVLISDEYNLLWHNCYYNSNSQSQAFDCVSTSIFRNYNYGHYENASSGSWYSAWMQQNNVATSLSHRKRAKQKQAKVVEIHPCANLFWLISLNSVLVGPVLASHPAMTNTICCAYFSPTLLSSLVLPPLLGNMHRWETGRPDLFDVFLRKKTAFHMRAVFATRDDCQSVALSKYQRAHWEACHGGALRWCLTSFLTANTKTGCTHNSVLSVCFN